MAPSSTDVARAYFDALSEHDLDAALALWRPGSVDRLVGIEDLVAPDGIRGYFSALFAAFPDWRFEVLETVAARGRSVIRWRATATFAGPGDFRQIAPNGASLDIEGADVITVTDGLITHNDAYTDTGEVLRQLGVLPPAGSATEGALARVQNVRTAAARLVTGGPEKLIAPGVWQVKGGLGHTMNVYLVEEPDGGVTVFDAGVKAMVPSVLAAGARLGGIRRVVLGHADCDHRGTAGALGAPIYVHALEREAAESADERRPYWDMTKLRRYARPMYARFFEDWDGGALNVAGTVAEGDEIAGFRVLHLPGHAPGLIGLYREEDGIALSSDTLYTLDIQTGLPGAPRVPHAAFNQDTDQARGSLERLAELGPQIVWAGHSHPVAGTDVPDQLRAAAQR